MAMGMPRIASSSPGAALALLFGLVLGPLLVWWQVGLDLLWTGVIGGSAAYAIYRIREALR